MGKWKVELVEEGVKELLQSEAIASVTSSIGETVRNACGGYGSADSSEFKTETKVGKNRVITNVSVDTKRAYYSNLKHNTLAKALGGAKSK